MRYNAHILATKRNNLSDVVPLDTPFTVLIETSRLCNFKCLFCPQSKYDEFPLFNDNLMSLDTFDRILAQLKEFPQKIKKIYMHGTGESLLNPDLPEMIRKLKNSNVTESIDLTSNGALLSPVLGEKLVDAGLNHLHISVEALSNDDYKKMAGISKWDFNSFVDQITYFSKIKKSCRLTIKIAERSIKNEMDKEYFFRVFGSLCDEIFIENIFPIWPGFKLPDSLESDGSAGQYGQDIQEKQVCPQIFTVLAIKCDGSVSPCSVDWKNAVCLGNINNVGLRDIWMGQNLRDLRKVHLEKGRKCQQGCKSCGLPKYSCIDNLDSYKEQILERI